MYIGEVIRRAQSYCPSEYEENEMYSWCDEVSSMLAIEDRNVFIREQFMPDCDGKVVLPKGVEFENIISVNVDGKELQKADVRTSYSFPKTVSRIDVTYLKPYAPIRIVSYTGEIEINKPESYLVLYDNKFREGDFISLTIDETSSEFKILGSEFDGDKCMLRVGMGDFTGMPDSGNAVIKRIITDKTICDAPYDTMYIDYILAKIGMLQHDFETYNQFMSAFNSRLNAYKKWITNQLPQSGGKLKNWW